MKQNCELNSIWNRKIQHEFSPMVRISLLHRSVYCICRHKYRKGASLTLDRHAIAFYHRANHPLAGRVQATLHRMAAGGITLKVRLSRDVIRAAVFF